MPRVERLPQPREHSEMSLEQAFLQRRSVRNFQAKSVSRAELGQLLWAAQGIRDDQGYRMAPSAGALYPLELFIVASDGSFQYHPHDHALLCQGEQDIRPELAQAALDQSFIMQAPLTVVFAGVPIRTSVRYGSQRSPRYIHMEVGHAAQNLMLQAVSFGLGTVAVGAFDDDRVIALLELPDGTIPLYLVPVGYPA